MVRPKRFELLTYRFVACCSIQLSYERLERKCRLSGAPEEIRTPDLQVRSLLLYPAELRAPDSGEVRQNGAERQAFFCVKEKFFHQRAFKENKSP